MTNGLEKNWRDEAAKIYSAHPDWNSGQIHRELIDRLDGVRAPGLNSVQKWRQSKKPNMDLIEDSGLEEYWHMGLLGKYNFPPEAVSKIFQLMKHGGHPTIRQAIWLSRFSQLPVSPDCLYYIAYHYAANEFLFQLVNGESSVFDATEIDKEIIDMVLPELEKGMSLPPSTRQQLDIKFEERCKQGLEKYHEICNSDSKDGEK